MIEIVSVSYTHLSPQQRTDFSMILKKTSLENIIDTIKFIEDRYKVIELLKSIVYDLSLIHI